MNTRNAITRLVTVVVAAAAWWALLGWDTERYRVGDQIKGPYSPGQVVAFVLILAAVAVWIGIRRDPLISSILLAIVTAVDFSISSASSDDSGLWAVGALFTLVGTLAGAAAVSFTANSVAAARR